MPVTTTRRWVRRITRGGQDAAQPSRVADRRTDDVVVEQPLSLALQTPQGAQVLVTTMRTPGHDLELAAGWLVSETGIRDRESISAMGLFTADRDAVLDDDSVGSVDPVDTVRIALADNVSPPIARGFMTTSSCGVCSAAALPNMHHSEVLGQTPTFTVNVGTLFTLVDHLTQQQPVFQRTGGVHAAALATPDGQILMTREDIGRHNAADKVIGWALLEHQLPLTDHLLVMSSRISYEIVQKALQAGCAGIVAVSAASSLAIDVAREHGLFLAGMVRPGSANVYAREDLLLVD